MYDTYMSLEPSDLARLDAALMRLRRLWSGPRTAAARPADRTGASDVELSTVLVVDAVVRGACPVSVGDVAAHLDVAPSTASRLVDRAVASGMVARTADPADSRRSVLQATTAGLAVHEEAAAFRTGYLARVLTGWTPAELSGFATCLDRFADAVTTSEPPDREGRTRP